jgi:hypothetical protein
MWLRIGTSESTFHRGNDRSVSVSARNTLTSLGTIGFSSSVLFNSVSLLICLCVCFFLVNYYNNLLKNLFPPCVC